MSTKNFNISVILPIKTTSVIDFNEYFDKCINSIKTQELPVDELVIVHTDETSLVEHLNNYDFGDLNVKKLVWTEEPDYSKQVNYGVQKASSEWVSLFEIDDEYSKIWFKNVKRYSEAYPEAQGFLPIVIDDDERGIFAGFTNEATFALNIASEMGILTNETLHTYQNFQISGMVIKKSAYLDYGGMKPSFKLTFGYEFFLRMTYNSVSVMTIPRLGYKHVNLREGSVFWNYKFGQDKMIEDEVKFWIQTAKREYFFTDDRSINYNSETI